MVVLIDKNRINFSELGIEENAKKLNLLDPIISVPEQTAGEYKNVAVDLSSSENSEELIDVKEYGIQSVPYYREQAVNNPLYNKNIVGAPDVNYARKGVCEKIKQANSVLDKINLTLIVVDAHRSPVTQNALFKDFLNRAYSKGLKGDAAKEFALTYCSSAENFNEKDSKTWSIHSTGGAVDVYLLDKISGKIVDLGEGCFDNPDNVTHTKHYENISKKTHLTKEQQGYQNARRVLFNVMNNAGFVNYGHECFHYSFNDPYYALVKGIPAKYGYKKPPKQQQLENMLSSVFASKKGYGK